MIMIIMTIMMMMQISMKIMMMMQILMNILMKIMMPLTWSRWVVVNYDDYYDDNENVDEKYVVNYDDDYD